MEIPFFSASSLYHLDKQFLQKLARFIRSIFWTSFLSSKCFNNLSSVADVQTGVVDYFHANPMRAKRAYICMPNDARYGVIGVESQDILTTECHTNEWNSDGSSNSLDDGNHQCTFFGELS